MFGAGPRLLSGEQQQAIQGARCSINTLSILTILSTFHETKDLAANIKGARCSINEHLDHVERLHETKDLATQPSWANSQSSLRDPRQAEVGWSCLRPVPFRRKSFFRSLSKPCPSSREFFRSPQRSNRKNALKPFSLAPFPAKVLSNRQGSAGPPDFPGRNHSALKER